MKKTRSFTILAAIMLLALAIPVHALISGPSLNATLLYYEPIPASPGSTLDVYIQIDNSGDTAKDVTVKFIDNYPFSLDSQSDRLKTISNLPGQESFLLKYKVRVDKDAVPGTSYVKTEISVAGSNNVQTFILPIEISASTVSLSMEEVDVTPATITPGQDGKLSFILSNTAQRKISSGSVELDLTDLDFVPVGSSNLKRFTDLETGASLQFAFDLSSSPSMSPGIYKIPIIITFKDQTGASYTQNEFIGLRVGADPELLIYVEQVSIPESTMEGDVIIKFVNKGLTGVKLLELEITPSDDLEVISESNRLYVGNIDEDDYETVSIKIKMENAATDIPIKVTYRDSLNRPYTQTANLHVTTSQTNDGSASSWVWIIVVVIVLAAAWFGFKRFRKGKK